MLLRRPQDGSPNPIFILRGELYGRLRLDTMKPTKLMKIIPATGLCEHRGFLA